MFEAVRGVECLKAQRRRMQVASIRHPLFRRTDQGKFFFAAEKSCAFPPPRQIVAFSSRERSFHNKWQKTYLSFYFYFNSTLFASTQIVEPHRTVRWLVRQRMRVSSSSSSSSSFSCYAVVGS